MAGQLFFSIIVPVYNRPSEVADLMASLEAQTDKGFEIVLVEDGSTETCRAEVERHPGVKAKYFWKENEGRSPARNYGIERADGDYLVFVDSDCVLPADYIERLRAALAQRPTDCFGGPDAAHESFSDLQKAINFSMTAFMTTGGIRGGKVQLEKFVPRTFNMGFSREVYSRVGGFREMFSEDIDMSTRIRNAGFGIELFREVRVFHKRRVDLKKFWRQVHVFGMSRITLELIYPGSMKAVHTLPAAFVVGSSALCLGAIWQPWLLAPLGAWAAALFANGVASTKSLKIGAMGVVTGVVQLWGYGTGFIRAFVPKILLRRGRDEAQEIEMRRGK